MNHKYHNHQSAVDIISTLSVTLNRNTLNTHCMPGAPQGQGHGGMQRPERACAQRPGYCLEKLVTAKILANSVAYDEHHSPHQIWAGASFRGFEKERWPCQSGGTNKFSIFYFEKLQTPKRQNNSIINTYLYIFRGRYR